MRIKFVAVGMSWVSLTALGRSLGEGVAQVDFLHFYHGQVRPVLPRFAFRISCRRRIRRRTRFVS